MRMLGVRLDLLPADEMLALLTERLEAPEAPLTTISTVNAECLAQASQDEGYRQVLNAFDLNVIDGVGVSMVAWLRGAKRPPRTPGSQLIYDLARLCAEAGRPLLLLGAAQRTATLACERLRALYPGLEVQSYSPGFSPSHRLAAEDEQAVPALLAELRPGVVCVALGMPKQERWIADQHERLQACGVRVAVGVGGAVAYVAGVFPEPPAWVRRYGLEWAYRLLREPHRRLGRQAARLPRFLALAGWEAIRLRLSGKALD